MNLIQVILEIYWYPGPQMSELVSEIAMLRVVTRWVMELADEVESLQELPVAWERKIVWQNPVVIASVSAMLSIVYLFILVILT